MAPVAEGAGAPGRAGWLRRGGAESGAGGAVVPGACREGAAGAEEPRRNQSRSVVERGGRAVLVQEMSSWNWAGVDRRLHSRAMAARRVSAEETCWRSW